MFNLVNRLKKQKDGSKKGPKKKTSKKQAEKEEAKTLAENEENLQAEAEEIGEEEQQEAESEREPFAGSMTNMLDSGNDEGEAEEEAEKAEEETQDLPPPSQNKYATESGPDLGDDSSEEEQKYFEEERIKNEQNIIKRADSDEIVKEEEQEEEEAEKIEEEIPVPASISMHKDSSLDERVFGVTVHGTDRLKTKLYISHPVVKMHLVDFETGQYVKKSASSRAVSYNRDGQQVDYILPLMTKPCDFRRKKMASPVWDEFLLLNELFVHISRPEIRAMLMFELLDYPSMVEATAAASNPDNSSADAWHKIAWAFLRVVGSGGSPNCGKRLRLQLYRAPKRSKSNDSGVVEVFSWWKKLNRIQYPACLYVTAKALASPGLLPSANRSFVALQPELPKTDPNSEDQEPGEQIAEETVQPTAPSWSRVPGQPCKIPNDNSKTLFPGRLGCFGVKFSSDGLKLACAACDTGAKYPVQIYEIPDAQLRMSLIGHLNVVYDMCFSQDCTQLLSASADNTARLWQLSTGHCVQVLPHTTFVYCCLFHPTNLQLILTASYDKFIRVWQITGGLEAEMLHQLSSKGAAINSMTMSPDKRRLLTGDSNGSVKIWAFEKGQSKTEKEIEGEKTNEVPLTYVREIRNDELKGQIVNCVHFVPDGKSLLVQTRDSHVRVLDMRTGVTKFRLTGANISNLHARSVLTPCSKILFSGAQDSSVMAWNIGSGQRIAHYSFELGCSVPSVDYHPLEHMLAVALYGQNGSVKIYTHDSNKPEIAQEFPLETQELKTKENDKSYLEFSVKQLLQEHRILTKLDSIEKMGKSIQREDSFPTESITDQLKSKQSSSEDSDKINKLSAPGSEIALDDSVKLAKRSVTFKENSIEKSEASIERKARALYDYTGQNGELSFRKNDTIEILNQEDEDWWVGAMGNKQGYLPSNYVEII